LKIRALKKMIRLMLPKLRRLKKKLTKFSRNIKKLSQVQLLKTQLKSSSQFPRTAQWSTALPNLL